MPVQGRFDLDPNEIVGIVEPAPALLGTIFDYRTQPAIADHRQQNFALIDGSADYLAKIDTWQDRGDVDEDGSLSEMLLQPIMESSGNVRTVLATIGQEQLGHGVLLIHQRCRGEPAPKVFCVHGRWDSRRIPHGTIDLNRFGRRKNNRRTRSSSATLLRDRVLRGDATVRWVGIDEAGYGPNLGPMVMTAVVAESTNPAGGDGVRRALARFLERPGGDRRSSRR